MSMRVDLENSLGQFVSFCQNLYLSILNKHRKHIIFMHINSTFRECENMFCLFVRGALFTLPGSSPQSPEVRTCKYKANTKTSQPL